MDCRWKLQNERWSSLNTTHEKLFDTQAPITSCLVLLILKQLLWFLVELSVHSTILVDCQLSEVATIKKEQNQICGATSFALLARLRPIRPSSPHLPLCSRPLSDSMARRKATKQRVKSFKFSSSQSDWLKQFASRYLTVEDNDPQDTAGEITKFIEDTYAELTKKYTFGESLERDIIIKVCSLVSTMAGYPI